jgi:hypothetical protein
MKEVRLRRSRASLSDGGRGVSDGARSGTISSGGDDGDLQMRGSRRSIVVLLILFSSVGVAITAIGWRQPYHSIPDGLLFVALGLALGSWSAFVRLSIRGDTLRYSVPLRRTIEVRLNQITHVGYEVGGQRYSDRFRPFMRLAGVAETPHGTKRFDIALQPFRPEDLRRLHQFLHERGFLAHGVDGSPAPPM